MDNVKLIAM